MKKPTVYLAAVLVSAGLLLAGCPTPKGPPAPTALGAFQKYLTATITPTAVPTWTPMPAQSPTPAPPPNPASVCPGVDLGVWNGYLAASGDTTGATDKFPSPACGGSSPGSRTEHVYSFTMNSSRWIYIYVENGSGMDVVGTLGTSCGAADLACDDSDLYAYLIPGTYYLTITGWSPGEEGSYAFYIEED